jgi:very-short-patch-repair endonuclease
MPHHRTTSTAFCYAQELRRETTDAEQRLWARLRMAQVDGVSFRRQHAIGPYIVDFCAPRIKLVVELDGGQHIEQETYDIQRTEFLASKGYRVLRFWNNEVANQIDEVMQAIWDAVIERH